MRVFKAGAPAFLLFPGRFRMFFVDFWAVFSFICIIPIPKAQRNGVRCIPPPAGSMPVAQNEEICR